MNFLLQFSTDLGVENGRQRNVQSNLEKLNSQLRNSHQKAKSQHLGRIWYNGATVACSQDANKLVSLPVNYTGTRGSWPNGARHEYHPK